jgi:hypothetical protein
MYRKTAAQAISKWGCLAIAQPDNVCDPDEQPPGQAQQDFRCPLLRQIKLIESREARSARQDRPQKTMVCPTKDYIPVAANVMRVYHRYVSRYAG